MPGQHDSSITRVAPVFEALRAAGHLPASLPRLLKLPELDGLRVSEWPNPGELEEAAWWPKEKRLKPPQSLLEHLVSELAGSGRTTTVPERQELFAGDEQALKDALALLAARSGSARRPWYVFEGKTSVDAYIRTVRYVVLVEGKRTERGPTTHTSWMAVRHQMLRNIDAAWDDRGARRIVAFFAVEGQNPDPTLVPGRWRQAVKATISQTALDRSLPHRSVQVRRKIAGCFRGAVTWQSICREFALPPETLIDKVEAPPSEEWGPV